MKFKHSLRIRITVTFFLFGTLLMITVAAGVRYSLEGIEERVIKANLQKELTNFENRYLKDPHQPLPHSASMTAYLVDAMEKSSLPVYMRDLTFGMHEIKYQDKLLHVIIDTLDGKVIAVELDATIFEHREEGITYALIFAVISASILSLWLGYALSQRAIAPVTDLARTVAVLEPSNPTKRLSTEYVNDEVGELAHTFDRYLDRLQDFISREQEFTENASHELRTPLTIIKGAVELLDADSELSPYSKKVLQRIKRATEAMSQMVDTLLVLAREEEVIDEEVPSASVLTQSIIADSSHLLKDKPVELNFRDVQDFSLQAPESILKLLLGNVLRNAIAYTREGNITVTIESPFIKVTDTGKGISTEHLPRIFDRHFRAADSESAGSGLGLAIVKRICDRYGWPIEVSSTSGKGTVVSLDFSNTLESDA